LDVKDFSLTSPFTPKAPAKAPTHINLDSFNTV